MRCLTAAGSTLILASRTALASSWPQVKVLVVRREEEEATKGLGAGREVRDERRGGGDEREGREERGLTRECERWAGGGREGKAGVEVRKGGRGELEQGVVRGVEATGRKEDSRGLLKAGEEVESGRGREEEE